MGVLERFEEKKKKHEENGGSYFGGVKERYEMAKTYSGVDTSGVDDKYISSLFSDAESFWNKEKAEQGDYNKWQEMNSRMDAVKAWAFKNRYQLGSEVSKSLYAAFNSFDSANQYWNQWESDDSYNAWLTEQQSYHDRWGKYAEAEDYETKSQYVSTANGQAELNPLSGTYTNTGFDDITYDYINRNEEAMGRMRVNNISDNTAFLGLDQSFLKTMTDDEIGIFNYLYSTQGSEKAYEYVASIESDLTYRNRIENQQYWAEYAKESPVESSAFSVLISPMKGLSFLGQTADFTTTGKIDQNAAYNKFSWAGSTIRGEVSNAIENSGNWGPVGSFTYQTGMSMGDFLFNTAITGGNQSLSLAIMGTGAAADTVISAKDRGLEDWQAFSLGTIAGAAEIVSEKISLDAWLGGDMTEGALKYILKNALAEGSEEVESSVINTIADILISGDKSEWKVAMEAYKAEGASTNEAWLKVFCDNLMQYGLDFLGGSLSGGVIGGGTYGISSIKSGITHGSVYSKDPRALVNEALEIDPSNELAQRMKTQLDAGKKVTNIQLAELVRQNEVAISKKDGTLEQTKEDSAGAIDADEYRAIVEASQKPQDGTEIEVAQVPTQDQKTSQAEQVELTEGKNTVNPIASAEIKATNKNQALTVEKTAPESQQDQLIEETEDANSLTLEEASKRFGAQAGAMIHTYHQGQSVEKYAAAYGDAFDMGKSGVSLSYASNSALTNYLTPEQRKLAWDAGQEAANAEALSRETSIKEQANGKTGWKKGSVRGKNVTVAELKKTFNDTQNTAYKLLSTYAEATGVDIVLYKSEAGSDGKFIGAQGKYDRKEPGTIYIDINAGLTNINSVDDLAKYVMLRTFAHEFTHFVENWNPVQYNEFRKVVFDTLTERGENAHDLIEQKQAENPGMTYDAASREVVAEAMTDILPDANFVQELAENHKTIFDKLLSKLKEFVATLKEYFNSIGGNRSKEANALKEQVGDAVHYVENIVKLFDNVAVQAVENYQKTVATEDAIVAEDKTTTDATEQGNIVAAEEAKRAEETTEPYKSENGYTITDNAEFNSIEIAFDGKPSEAIRDVLKANKFKWLKSKQVWYGRTSRDTIREALDKAYKAEANASKGKSNNPVSAFLNGDILNADVVAKSIHEGTFPTFPGWANTKAPEVQDKEFDKFTARVDEELDKLRKEDAKPGKDIKGENVAAEPSETESVEKKVEQAPSERETIEQELLRALTKLSAQMENAGKAVATENKEVNNYEQSENGTDEGTVQQPVPRSEDAPQLLEGVRPGSLQRSSSGGGSVRAGEQNGAEDAGRDGQPDQSGVESARSALDRVGGHLQPVQDLNQKQHEVTEEQRQDDLHEEVQQEISRRSTTKAKGNNFVIGDSLDLPNGTKARTRANIEAIKLVKQLAAEGRFATAEEQVVLSKYVGWGGLADAFGKPVSNRETRKLDYEPVSGLEAEFADLKDALTEDEYKAARESTKNAHYTSIEVIKAMYDGLKYLGFTGGRMLEPSSGVGNFVGAMPSEMSSTVKSWTMVELDNITGQIAKYLYPHADVRIQGFEETNIPDGYMDVAIGNVPFGNYSIYDKHYPKTVTGSIHNYFFAKALDKVRAGGLVMFITSSYTMNSRDNAVRKYIMDRAELLGAIRLPNNAFAGNAGTSVVTDILVLKKRADRTAYAGEKFLDSGYKQFDGGWAYSNDYFANHPEMVLGIPKLERGMYSANELTYEPFTDRGSLGDQIREAMGNIKAKMDYNTPVSPEKANFAQQRAKKSRRLQVKDGTIKAVDENGNVEDVDVDKDTAKRITGLVAIRDAHTALADSLQQGVSAKEANRLRKSLNKVYDDFVSKYGIINSPKNKRALNQFADRYSIMSLENYDASTKTATKADIFSKNTIATNRTADSAESVEDGLTISLNAEGRVNVELISKLTGQKAESVTRQLIDQRLVFKDKDGNLIPAVQYLSGNVRAKLREMEGLVGIDSDYRNNVEALRAIIPTTIPYTDIFVSPGATWIPVSVYEDFVGHILNRSYNGKSYRTGKKDFQVEHVPETNEYDVTINDTYAKRSAQNTQVWGEGGKTFEKIFENMLNGRRTNVWTKGEDGKSVLDKAKTEAVAEKVEKLNEEFRKWLWEDENRRADLQELYNESYNAFVTPHYSGESLTVNGLNASYTIRPHQLDAVARIVNSGGNTLLAHRVGAGKTMEMAAAAMKLKQLGVIKKPMFVVPNNVVAQWGKEFKDYFPAANILVVGDEDMTPAERMTTINRIKNNDYDAVILAYTKFEKIPMTSAWRQRFYEEQIEDIMFAINAEKEATSGKGFSVKQLEKKRKQLENKVKKLTDKAKDEDGAMFEDLGVDALFVDEAHNFKNLEYTTRMANVSGLGNADGSQKAFDLYTKVRYLQQLNGGRGIVFATATPVMNSMTEMYIMQRYLQPDIMKQLGIDNFDAWAKMFGEVVNALEIAPSGRGYRVKQSFSKFKNIKALQQLFRSFTDVLTDVPGLKIPKMKGGKVQIVECEQSEFQENFMADLAKRAENVRNVDPKVDNMLKITSDGRKISYSQRMFDPTLPYEENGKIYKCCENVFRVWQESEKTKGTQMIFCDMATPKGKSKVDTEASADEFDSMDTESAQLYDDMKARLIKLGIPANEIAFVHDAKNNGQKAALADKMNDGTIRVMIGSTGKMGVGLNAQKKAVAIHHLDAPWRPGDIEQRDGRVFRQRNENDEVYKFVYVTAGSFDSRLWDILERKQKFINQVMNGEDVGNEVEDTGEVTLSAAEVKAVASGSPLIMEQVVLEKEISKLESLQQAHNANVNRAKEKIVEDNRKIAALQASISNVQEDIKNRKDTYSSDKKFSMQIGGQTYTDKKDAGAALIATAEAKAQEGSYTAIGKFAGFELLVVKTKEGIKGAVAGAQNYDFKTYPANPTYGINHLIAIVEGLDGRLQGWKTALYETNKDLEIQKALASESFGQADKLKQKRARYNEVMDILNPPTEQTIADDDTQEQSRTDALTDWEVLEMAVNELNAASWNDAERSALDIFSNRLTKLHEMQDERKDLGTLYKEQQFGANVNRADASRTLERMKVLDAQIKKASEAVLDVENKSVLKNVLQKARRVIELQERAHGQEVLNNYRNRRKNAEAIKKYKTRIQKDVTDLTNRLLRPDNKDIVKHVPDVLKNSVIQFLTSIDFTSKRQLNGGEATKADKIFMKNLNGLKAAIKENQDMYGLYSGYNDLPPDFMEKLQSFIDTTQALVEKNSGEYVINQMSADELKELSSVVRRLKMFITQINRFHANAMYQHTYEAGDNSISSLSEIGTAAGTGKAYEFFMWQQIRPAYAFERFGKGGEAIFDGLRRGQAKMAFNTTEIEAFAINAYSEQEVREWEKEVKTINLGNETIRMPVSSIMSFYELSKRPQALSHILGQGIRVATFANGKEKITDVGHRMTEADVQTIVDTLSPRQKQVADNLQKYMAEHGGELGNHVSVKRFGEEMFGEKTYFPIHSDGRHLKATAEEYPSAASLYALLNMGFTKQLQEDADNRLVIYSIFDVFSSHMASMAQYNAFALPILDALKWLNYQQVEIDENGNKIVLNSVRDEMARVYGVPAESRPGKGKQGYAENFVVNIIKAFNGTEAQGTPNDTLGLKALRNYNRAQIAFNGRVVIQQPLAITRAAMLLDYKSIINGMKLSPSAIKQNIQEMHKHSGIAAWKDLGFYDINVSRGLTSVIKHDISAIDAITDVGMMGAEKADVLTWAAIWSACKEEVGKKQRLTPKDEGYFDAVTKLFEDVIYKTQVVDSVLTKNEFMRDKGFFARAVSSFMSEGVTTASMLIDAFDKYYTDIRRGMTKQQAWKKNGKMIGRVTYVYCLGAVALAAAQAVADAWRDDDDYQKWYEKWLEAFSGNLVEEIMPLGKLPIVSDFYEVVKELIATWTGWDIYGNAPQSVFMQWYDSLIKGMDILHDKISGEDTNYTWYGGIYKLLQAVSGMSGLPMAAFTREVVGLWNNAIGWMAPSLKIKSYGGSGQSQVKYAYWDGHLTKAEAIYELKKQTDMDDDEIEATVKKWSCKVVTGTAYEDIKSEYLAGRISKKRAIRMYVLYGGYSQAEAEKKVDSFK